MHALGVDAAGRAGWLGVVVGDEGFLAAHVERSLTALLDTAERALGRVVDAVGIDIPIGLVHAPQRQADVAARAYVGPRRSSVFPAPNAGVLNCESQAQANSWLAERGLPLMSSQSVALLPRIREAAVLAAHDDRVIEVFPEATFRYLAAEPVEGYKKSWGGTVQRLGLLAGAEPPVVVPWDLGLAAKVPTDDVFDAAAAAWSAHRYAHGRAVAHGDPAEVDATTGRHITMWV